MTDSDWKIKNTSANRQYLLGKDLTLNFENSDDIFIGIVKNILKTIQVQSTVRLILDGYNSHPEQVFIPTPFIIDPSELAKNLGNLLLQSSYKYYISANPKTSHFGIANTILEQKNSSFFKREIESLLKKIYERPDLAGRILKGVQIIPVQQFEINNPFRFKDTIQKVLSIHIGCQIHINGQSVNYNRFFLPIQCNSNIINCLYYNLENIITQNLISYDEISDHHLTITQRTILKELEGTIGRLKVKASTRKKLLNDLVPKHSSFNYFGNDPYFPQLNGQPSSQVISDEIVDTNREFLGDSGKLSRTNAINNVISANIYSQKSLNISDIDRLNLWKNGINIPPNKDEKRAADDANSVIDRNMSLPNVDQHDESIEFESNLVDKINYHPNDDDFEKRKGAKRNYVPHPFENLAEDNTFKRRKSDWTDQLPDQAAEIVKKDNSSI